MNLPLLQKNIVTEEIIAVGKSAFEMIGRTPENIVALRPMKDGVIADYNTTTAMLKYFIQSIVGRSFFKPVVIICVPSGITDVEKRAVLDATKYAGAKKRTWLKNHSRLRLGQDFLSQTQLEA